MQFPAFHRESVANAADRPFPSASRIIIAKWDMLTADVLCRLAREAYPSADVTLCRTGADTLDALRRKPATLGLFGLTMPDIDGLDLLTLVADEHLVNRRMIVTGRRDDYSRQAVRVARVHGVFDTSVEGSDSLVAAIRRVGDGGEYYSAGTGEPEPAAVGEPAMRVRNLSFVEQQVFAIMLEGEPDEQISTRLGMSLQAIVSHRTNILKKLNVRSVDELPVPARRLSWWK